MDVALITLSQMWVATFSPSAPDGPQTKVSLVFSSGLAACHQRPTSKWINPEQKGGGWSGQRGLFPTKIRLYPNTVDLSPDLLWGGIAFYNSRLSFLFFFVYLRTQLWIKHVTAQTCSHTASFFAWWRRRTVLPTTSVRLRSAWSLRLTFFSADLNTGTAQHQEQTAVTAFDCSRRWMNLLANIKGVLTALQCYTSLCYAPRRRSSKARLKGKFLIRLHAPGNVTINLAENYPRR